MATGLIGFDFGALTSAPEKSVFREMSNHRGKGIESELYEK